MSREELAQRQASLVVALVGAGQPPAGFDLRRVRAAADALLRKRSGEVSRLWPGLRASYGPQWIAVFADWAAGQPSQGALHDGASLARIAAGRGELQPDGLIELARYEVSWRCDRAGVFRRRWLPALRRGRAGAVLRLFGRDWTYRRQEHADRGSAQL